MERYSSSDGFTLDKKGSAGKVLVNPAETEQATPTGADATDADLLDIAKDGELSEVIHDDELLAYNKDAYRATEPTAAAQGTAAGTAEEADAADAGGETGEAAE